MLRLPPEFSASAGALIEAGFAVALHVRDRNDMHRVVCARSDAMT